MMTVAGCIVDRNANLRSHRQGRGCSCHRAGESTRPSGCGRRPTGSPEPKEFRNAEPDPIQGSRPGNHPGGSRTTGSVAGSALSHVPWRMAPAMEPSLGKTAQQTADRRQGRRRGGSRGALVHMHAANMRARALSAVIQDIRAAGFISYNAVARELNRRRVPTLRNGRQWYPTTVSRLLVRLSKMKA